MATVRALDIADDPVDAEVTVDLQAPKVEWQHVVPVTGLQANKTHRLEVVFDGCVGPVSGPIN